MKQIIKNENQNVHQKIVEYNFTQQFIPWTMIVIGTETNAPFETSQMLNMFLKNWTAKESIIKL